jgi:hypothetical protein
MLSFGTPALAEGPSAARAPSVDTQGVYPLPELGEDWKKIESIHTRVHYLSDNSGTARSLLEHAESSIPRLSEELDLPTGGVIDIVLSPDTEHFREVQPGTPPTWADATAWPQSGMIFMRAPKARNPSSRPLTQVLDHELVHVILGRAFAPNPVPSWLQEGTAQLLANEYTPDLTKQLASGLLGDNLLELDDLTTGFPSGSSKAALAYAQSADLMAYIRTEYGDDAFHGLIQHMADGKPADAAIRLATGKSMSEVDREWRGRLESGPLWLQAVVNDTSLIGMAAILFALGFWRFRARKKAILDQWEEEEAARDLLYARLARHWETGEPMFVDAESFPISPVESE